MKLKDYEIPQYGLNDGFGQEDLAQYSLKNFDLKAYQRSQEEPEPEPMAAPCEPYPVAAVPEPPSPEPLYPATPVQTVLSQPALDPGEVHFGAHFTLQTVSYNPLSPAQKWKLPRWVVGMVGLFFGSAAVMTIATCVVLLRDPKPAPTAQLAAPTAPVATTPAAPTPPPAAAVTRAAPALDHSSPALANPRHDNSALPHRIVVSRHPGVVRRRVAGKSTPSSVEPQETETASRRPPPDALDKLLSESSL